MPVVSVVVPIYNADKYLDKCLSSLSYLNECFDILLIDDGSTDNSAKICQAFCNEYSNFHYIKKENGGPSSARNLGIYKSKTPFITFVDADDWIQPEAYNCISKKLDDKSELVCIRSQNVISEETKVDKIGHDYEIFQLDVKKLRKGVIYSNYKYVYKLIKEGYIFHGPMAKFYLTTILNQNAIRFPEKLSYGEDICFNIDYLANVKSCIAVNIRGYYYRQSESSIMHSFQRGKSQSILNFVRVLAQKMEDEDDWKLFYKTGIRQYLFALKLEFCNRKNKEEYIVRRREALEYLTKEPYAICKEMADYKDMPLNLRGMSFLVKRKAFVILNLLIKQKFK